MEIKNLRKIEGTGRTKAYFSVSWPGKFTINDCSLVEGNDGGYFVGMPQKSYTKDGNKKYSYVVWIDDKSMLEKIRKAATEAYGGEAELEDDDIPF